MIGVDVLTLRRSIERISKNGIKGHGTFVTVDRMGIPLVNTLFIPFDLKDTYNRSSVHADGSVVFISDTIPLPIFRTLADLGLVTEPPEPAVDAMRRLIQGHGDLLQVEVDSVPNTGTNLAAAFPNGRRVHDDTVDYILTQLNHGAPPGRQRPRQRVTTELLVPLFGPAASAAVQRQRR